MSEYIVSARKYRPDTFESLIGQDNIAQTLKNSILRGQLAHAYLFCGPRGVGKTSAARIFAKTINCSNPGEDMQPCGECESCKSFKEGRSYCIHELDAASNNGVEDIKTLMDQVQIPPQTGRYSVYIIDEVHMLSASAFNAFLKTLEEPPAHAIFILATTEKHKILPTILSRCQTYDFNRISVPDIVRNLREIALKENVIIDDESLHVIAHKADGAMRDALTIFDQTVAFCGTDVKYEDVLRNLNVLDYEYSFRLVDAFLKGDYASALLIFDEVLNKGFNALYFVTALGSHLRDLLVSRTGGLESLLDLPESLRRRYADQAANCSVKFLYDALGICSQCEAGYRASSNQRLHIEFALMKLAFLQNAPVAAPVQTAVPAATPSEAKTPAQAEPVNTEVAAETPAAPAGRRRGVLKSATSALSLNALMNEAATARNPIEKEEIVETPASSETAAAPSVPELTVEEVTAKFREFGLACQNANKLRLAHLLLNCEVQIEERDGFKWVLLSVLNEGQKRSMVEDKISFTLEGRLRSHFKIDNIKVDAYIIPEEEKPDIKYMPSEKADDLIRRNPEVKKFVHEFDLDVQ